MPPKLFTFEYDVAGDAVQIHLNDEGAAELIRVLERLRACKADAHDHLKSPSWGGSELTEVKQGTSTTLVNHVKLFYWRE